MSSQMLCYRILLKFVCVAKHHILGLGVLDCQENSAILRRMQTVCKKFPNYPALPYELLCNGGNAEAADSVVAYDQGYKAQKSLLSRRGFSAAGAGKPKFCPHAHAGCYMYNVGVAVVDPDCLSSFTATRLIVLDKHPGVRPIAVGEVSQRIILAVASDDVCEATGYACNCVQDWKRNG